MTFRKTDDSEFSDADLLNIVSTFKGSLDNRLTANTVYNVNSTPSNYTVYYTLSTAIEAIPLNNRIPLMTICYRTGSDDYEYAQYLRSVTINDYFLNSSNWKIVLNTSTLDSIESKSFTNVQIYNNSIFGYSSITEAAATITFADRKFGHILNFRDATDGSIWHTFQFRYSDVSDTYWLNANSWTEYNKFQNQPVINVNDYTNNSNFFTLSSAVAAIAENDRIPG